MPERPLRVCIPIGKYPPLFSGHGIQTQRTLPHLRARGIEVTILTRRLPRAWSVDPRDDGFVVDRVLPTAQGRFWIPPRFVQFRRYFNLHRGMFDVLHNDLPSWEFLLNIRHLKSLGLPVIMEMVLLGDDDPATMAREHFGSLKLRLLRDVDIWIGISRMFLPRLREVGIPEDRFRLIYTGVDVERYRPLSGEAKRALRSRLGLPMEGRIVVSVGSVLRRKGMDRLLRVWERLSPRHDRDVLLVVGPATAADGLGGLDLKFAESLMEQSRAPHLEGRVRWVGRADNVVEYLCAADLFLFLSRQEGLGTVILEALACGLPTVVSPLDGIAAEIVTEGRTGYIVKDADSPGEVAALVGDILGRPLEQASLSEAARKSVLERFSLGARADALATLYADLVARGRSPARGAP